MSYLVLARRLRPQTFEQVIGQDHVTKTLKNALSTDRLAQAFLFSGTRGVGKTSAARILAKAINCLGPVTEAPCNVCGSCVEIDGGGSVDVLEIDGASNNSVEQIRDLRENAQYLPASSKRKIYIIDEVHMLSKGAFNALLKTLEEPPEHVVFIFATTEVHKVPATILSRCQRYNFRPIPPGQILEYLQAVAAQEKLNLDQEAASALARAARGSMRDALSLLDQTVSFSGQAIDLDTVRQVLGLIEPQLIHDMAGSVLNSDGAGVLAGVAGIAEGGYDLRSLYQELLTHFRNLVVLKVDPRDGGRTLGLSQPEVELFMAQIGSSSAETLQLCLQGLIESERTLKAATQPRIAVELALLKICHMIPVAGLDEILVRLDNLKNGLDVQAIAPPQARPQDQPAEQAPPEPPPPAPSPPDHPPEEAGAWAGPDPGPVPEAPPDPGYAPDPDNVQASDSVQALGDVEESSEAPDPVAGWSQFVSRPRGLKPSLRALLAPVKAVRLDNDKLYLENGSSFDFLSDPDRKAALEAAVAGYFGRRYRLEMVTKQDEPPRKKERSNKEPAKKMALKDPLVKAALELFDGNLVKIEPADK